ncbi:hypothetical protein QUA41_26810 [Microcoleus sp. Pol11C1]
MSIHLLHINTKFALNFRHSGKGWFWSAIDPRPWRYSIGFFKFIGTLAEHYS